MANFVHTFDLTGEAYLMENPPAAGAGDRFYDIEIDEEFRSLARAKVPHTHLHVYISVVLPPRTEHGITQVRLRLIQMFHPDHWQRVQHLSESTRFLANDDSYRFFVLEVIITKQDLTIVDDYWPFLRCGTDRLQIIRRTPIGTVEEAERAGGYSLRPLQTAPAARPARVPAPENRTVSTGYRSRYGSRRGYRS